MKKTPLTTDAASAGEPQNNIEMWDRREVSEKLKVTTMTVKRWEKRGILKPYRIGPKLIRFKQSDILALVADAA